MRDIWPNVAYKISVIIKARHIPAPCSLIATQCPITGIIKNTGASPEAFIYMTSTIKLGNMQSLPLPFVTAVL